MSFYQFVWDPPQSLPTGVYLIKAYFAGDPNYKPSEETTSCRGDLTVVPEYAYGGLIAL